MAAAPDPRLNAELMLKDPQAYARMQAQAFVAEHRKKMLLFQLRQLEREHAKALKDLDKKVR